MNTENERYAKRGAELDRRGRAMEEARRPRDVFWIRVVTVAVGLVAAAAAVVTAWPMVRDWIS